MATFKKRSGNWCAEIRRKGHKTISKTFSTKALAQEWARSIEQQMDSMKFTDNRSISDLPTRSLIERYMEEFGSFGKNKQAVLTSLKESVGKVSINNLTGDRLMEFVRDRQWTAGGVTIAIDLTYLKQVLTTAKFLWKLPVSPGVVDECRVMMHYAGIDTRSTGRDRRPSESEIQLLIEHIQQGRYLTPYADLIQFAIASAMRLGEITRITWADLNEIDKTITIRDRKDPKQKSGNDQLVPLLGAAFDIVMRQPKTSDKIFPYSEKSISSVFPRMCAKLGIEDLHFHDFRHEGCSRLFEQGYQIQQVALISGHKDWKMLQRYTQLKAKDLHRAP